jgi:chitin disaccharide deacetylase
MHTAMIFPLCLIFTSILSTHVSNAQTVAERLGYPADAKLLIVHADDMGMCHSANQACIDTLEKGIVKSASVMVPCPWFMEAALYAKEHPEADLGLHLTLTSEWKRYRWSPLAEASTVKGLIDPDGYMFRGVRAVLQSASAQEVENELRAQIEFALHHGIQPTHLDSHMGTLYAKADYLEVALRLAEEYDIPFMFFNPTEIMYARAQKDGVQLPTEISQQMSQRGIPLLDGLLDIENTSIGQMEAAYKKLIAEMQPGLYQIIIHPNLDTAESQAITGTHKKRAEEHRIFTDPGMKSYIEEQGVILVGWKDLLPLWKARKR